MSILTKKKKAKTAEEFLMTVANERELSLVESILLYEGISFHKKHINTGHCTSQYIGFTNPGIELFVSGEDLHKARDAVYRNSNAPQESTKDLT